MRSALSDWLFHVVLAVGIICGIAIAPARAQLIEWEGAAPDIRYPTHDAWGNRYPPTCRRDLSFLLKGHAIVKRENLNKMLGPIPGMRRWGWYTTEDAPVGKAFIYIDHTVPASHYEYVLHHELCHAICEMLYGNASWHAE